MGKVMTSLREDAALAFLETMKERARYEPNLRFTYSLPGHRQLGVTYWPDMNYGRFQPPHEGLEGFSYRWSLYTPAFYAQDAHVEAPERGWRGLSTGPLGECYKLRREYQPYSLRLSYTADEELVRG